MPKKQYILALISFLLIPVASVLGGLLFIFINPEIAAGYPNYVRNYWLLDQVKHLVLLATLLTIIGLWFLTCLFLVNAKRQSYWWLPVAIFGPLGFTILTILNDKAPAPGDLYQYFVGRLNIYLRVAYEICLFLAVWTAAFSAMVLHRDLMILYEAATTGVSMAKIIDQQNASSGMWAFGEGLEVLYLVVLSYLLWPIFFNLAGHLLMILISPNGAHERRLRD